MNLCIAKNMNLSVLNHLPLSSTLFTPVLRMSTFAPLPRK